MSLNSGDTIYISSDIFDVSRKVEIKWQEWNQELKDNYFAGTFFKGEGESKTEGLIFISEKYKPAFEKLATKTEEGFKVVIDKSFQYGQLKKDGTGRWLVFHDKKRNIYQHRFQKSIVNKAADWIGKLKNSPFADVSKWGQAVFGDNLHDFE